jgi:plastocyanin
MLLTVFPAATIACGYGTTPSTNPPPPPPTGADINIVAGAQSKGSAAFSPNPKTLSLAGSTTVDVRWVNGDIMTDSYNGSTAVTHRIKSDDGTSFDTGNLGGNATSTKSLPAGTYPYHCTQHTSMVGTVIVNP